MFERDFESELDPDRRVESGRFIEAIAGQPVSLIAEFKRKSPHDGWIVSSDYPVAETVWAYEAGGAAALSLLADEAWGGSVDDIRQARATSELPILAKGYFCTVRELEAVREAGADAALLVVGSPPEQIIERLQKTPDRLPLRELNVQGRKLGLNLVFEVTSEQEIYRALVANAEIIAINNRNLKNGGMDERRALNLKSLVPREQLVIGASGLESANQVADYNEAKFDAVLVGSALMHDQNPEQAVRELLGG
ncbi:indole-3-glycerol-phosphate synthase [Patescibacteria group bacterium]|nr:indole-3-glycerol-phosphate synthase [Patescibacteria group bacterium]